MKRPILLLLSTVLLLTLCSCHAQNTGKTYRDIPLQKEDSSVASFTLSAGQPLAIRLKTTGNVCGMELVPDGKNEATVTLCVYRFDTSVEETISRSVLYRKKDWHIRTEGERIALMFEPTAGGELLLVLQADADLSLQSALPADGITFYRNGQLSPAAVCGCIILTE